MAYIGSKPANKPVVASDLDPAVITGQTALATSPADTDEFLISDAGVLKRLDASLVGSAGITVVDQWRLAANLSISGNGTTAVTANLERVDTLTPGFIGTGMSESSGVFTFPQTGIYKITSNWSFLASADSTFLRINNEITTDNSTYETTTEAGVSHAENGQYSTGSSAFTFDVTNTTTHKVRFRFRHNNSGSVLGSSTVSKTNFLFERLGDT